MTPQSLFLRKCKMTDSLKLPRKERKKVLMPSMSLRDYNSLGKEGFDELCEQLSDKNRDWIKENAPNQKISWMYVSRRGRIWGYGEGSIVPTDSQTREAANFNHIRTPLFLLKRNNSQYCDTSFFMKKGEVVKVAELFNRCEEDFSDYRNLNEGIATIQAQSGLVNKLVNARYAVGKLIVRKTLKPGEGRDGVHYKTGAVVVNITGINWASHCEVLHLGAQDKTEVHKRGGKVTGERPGEEDRKIKRIQLLHRVSDPIIDIFDTWEIKSRGWNSLVLHGAREEFGAPAELEKETIYFNWFPLHEPYARDKISD